MVRGFGSGVTGGVGVGGEVLVGGVVREGGVKASPSSFACTPASVQSRRGIVRFLGSIPP